MTHHMTQGIPAVTGQRRDTHSEGRIGELAEETRRLQEELGLNPVPLRAGERAKMPFLRKGELKGFFDRRSTRADARVWHQRNRDGRGDWYWGNLGLVTGSTSGLFVVDVDGEEAWEYLEHLDVGQDSRTWRWTTGRGEQLAFEVPDRVDIPTFAGRGALLQDVPLDIKGERGYVVIPPSVHPSGRSYTYEPGMKIGDIPLAPAPDKLIAAIDYAERSRV